MRGHFFHSHSRTSNNEVLNHILTKIVCSLEIFLNKSRLTASLESIFLLLRYLDRDFLWKTALFSTNAVCRACSVDKEDLLVIFSTLRHRSLVRQLILKSYFKLREKGL